MKVKNIIAIAGESSGGKSTISDKIAEMLTGYKIKMIHMDSYYKEERARPRIIGVTDGKDYVDDNHPDALDLERFHQDVKAACEEEWDVLLIEGIFALWDEEILSLADLKVFVDCDPDERLARRVSRHLSYGQKLDEIMGRYVQAVQPRQREMVSPTRWQADLILNGFARETKGVDLLVSWIRQQCKVDK